MDFLCAGCERLAVQSFPLAARWKRKLAVAVARARVFHPLLARSLVSETEGKNGTKILCQRTLRVK
jgi:hypothetical protein